MAGRVAGGGLGEGVERPEMVGDDAEPHGLSLNYLRCVSEIEHFQEGLRDMTRVGMKLCSELGYGYTDCLTDRSPEATNRTG